jgi:hypothetical protein
MPVRGGEGRFMPHKSLPRRRARELSVVCAAVAALVLPAQGRADDSAPFALLEPVPAVGPSLPTDVVSTESLPTAAAPVEQPSLADVAAVVQAAVDAAATMASVPVEAVAPQVAPTPDPEPTDPVNTSTPAISPAIPAVSDGATVAQAAQAASTPVAAPAPPLTIPAAPAPSAPAAEAVSAPGTQVAATTPAVSPIALPPAAQPAPPPVAPPDAAAQPGGAQYQDGNTTDISGGISTAPASPPSADPIPPDPPPIAPETWIWNWTWNCEDGAMEAPSPPSDQAGGAAWIWNWQWNCGVAAPANTAISIRILSPGNDGDVSQAISVTTSSIAQSISSTVQQAIQQATPSQLLPAVTPLPDAPPGAGALAPVLATALAWFGIDPIPPVIPGDSLVPGDLFADATLAGAAYGFADQLAARSSLLGLAADPGSQSHALREASFFTPAPPSKARAGRVEPSHPPKPLHRRAPPPRAPFGFPPDLSAGGTAPGSSSSLGGFALLLGALLMGLPSTRKLLWVGVATRPRRRAPGRSERPG